MSRRSIRARRSSRARLACLVACIALPTVAAAEPTAQECGAAYEEVQVLMQKSQLREAEAKALVCVNDSCAGWLKKECGAWLVEIQKSLPTITFEVKDASGNETTSVKVSVDDRVVAEKLGGASVAVDPGEHRFRFEIEGQPPREETFVIRQGEKNRKLSVSFQEKGADTSKPDEPSKGGGGIHPATWVLGGVGIAGLAVFAGLGVVGLGEKSDAEAPVSEGGCAPNCSEDQVDSIRTKFLVADIMLGVGGASLGVAVVLLIVGLTSDDGPSKGEKATWNAPVFTPLAGGGAVTWSGSF